MTTISSGATGATASVISSSATNSPYSTNKSGIGAAATIAGATHVAFADSVGADPASVAAVPSIDSGERYRNDTLSQPKLSIELLRFKTFPFRQKANHIY